MDKNEKISIVVPIYNVEEYLPRCLDSIIAQTYSNIEVLLVDDGTPDNAGAICDSYAEKDSRIRVFHIPNGGVAKARQLGVENSTGEYIVFVDPDDWLPLDSIATLYTAMTPDLDIVIGSNNNISNKITVNRMQNKILSIDEYRKQMLCNLMYFTPWGKLYKRNLFNEESFPVFKIGQDMLMNIFISIRCSKSIKISDTIVYNYYIRNESATSNHKRNLEYETRVIKQVMDYYTSKNLYDSYKNELMTYSLMRLYGVIIDGNKCNLSDDIVKYVYLNSGDMIYNMKAKMTRLAIKYSSLQFLLYKSKQFITK